MSNLGRGDLIYTASRAKVERAVMWKKFRDRGYRIVSTWIDEVEEGKTDSFVELWHRIHREINQCDRLVLYAEPDDFPLKGALVEVGMAVGLLKSVTVCLPGVVLTGRTSRPVGSWIEHPQVTRVDDVRRALAGGPGL